MDNRVIETPDETRVTCHYEPTDVPDGALWYLKNIPVTEGVEFSREGGVVTWVDPISTQAPVRVTYSDGTPFWIWSADLGDVLAP